MSKFKYAYNLDGKAVPMIMELPIVTNTAIEEGEIVKFTPGTGVVAVAGTDFDDPALGVAAESHDGATAGRQKGLLIKVYVDPNAVFSHDNSNIITATGGSATTFVVSGLLPQTDDLWNGGMLQVVTCVADSTMVGKKIPITDCTGASGTITFGTQGAAFASGDTARLCPGRLAATSFGWDLDGDGTAVDWDTSGGESLILVDADPTTMTSFWKLRLHQFGNHVVAL